MAECLPQRVSVGEILTASGEIRYFLMMAGAGFDAKVIYHLSAGLKDQLGKLSYFLGGVSRLGGKLDELEVRINGQLYPCTFALISKVRNYGGDFEIAREVILGDDHFEVVLFEGRNSWRYVRYLFGVATKHLKHTPGVSFFRTDCVELRPLDDEVHLQADGEYIGSLPAQIRVLPDALTLLLPDPRGDRLHRQALADQIGFSRR